MKIEATIDKTALIETVRREYGTEIERITFVPVGWVACSYIADCAGGERYFLKLDRDSEEISFAASNRNFYLSLTHQLYSKRILPHIACPVKTRAGQLAAPFEEYVLILFNFIEGETVGFGNSSDEILMKLARLVGILHKSIGQIKVERPFYERFDIVFKNDLVNGFDILKNITSGDRWGKRELRDLLLPHRDEIKVLLQRLQNLQTLARAVEKEMVVCHTDLHGGNLMTDAQGNLYIVDWENAMIAPPEHDLFFWAEHDYFWDSFLPIYEREFGPASLDIDVFGFYYYRRNLEDLADFVRHILYRNTDDKQDKKDIYWIGESCISGWSHLETKIARIKTKLAERKR
ncbi:MAG: aminoglycoside phosphotransferase family protein [Chloroflexi bacterium]|nr:aminoglycoside phosphotransferase family protein [Chloroflexota bacterium]